jgi:cytochrome c oxidase subunit III
MSDNSSLQAGEYHYITPEGGYHGAKLGMWVFLATEVHLFGVLFCTFAIFRWKYLEMFDESARSLNWMLGGLNTVILLTSSYFMVRAVDAAQKGLNKKVKFWIELTLIFGLLFFIVKFFEYNSKLSYVPPILPSTNIFYGLYYTMTAIHGLHVLVGMGVMLWLRELAKKNTFRVTYYTPVEVTGLYWHLVDVIWIYLFPLLYLLGGID